MKPQYAMYMDRYLVKVVNDNSQRGYKIKIRFFSVDTGKDSRTTKWVHAHSLQKLTPEVVDIIVASHVDV